MRTLARFFFFGGFVFLVGVGMWAVVTITRMKREQASAIAMLRTLTEIMVLKDAVQKIGEQAAHRSDAEPL